MQKWLLSTVTDQELFVSTWVTFLFTIILGIGLVWNGVRSVQVRKGRVVRALGIGLFLVLGVMAFKRYLLERSLLRDATYTKGTTLGPCQVTLKGKGVRFRYTINGTTYTNCNTFHPVKEDRIKKTNGHYKVRYSPAYPSKGRMNFKKPVKP